MSGTGLRRGQILSRMFMDSRIVGGVMENGHSIGAMDDGLQYDSYLTLIYLRLWRYQ